MEYTITLTEGETFIADAWHIFIADGPFGCVEIVIVADFEDAWEVAVEEAEALMGR